MQEYWIGGLGSNLTSPLGDTTEQFGSLSKTEEKITIIADFLPKLFIIVVIFIYKPLKCLQILRYFITHIVYDIMILYKIIILNMQFSFLDQNWL